MSGRSRFDSCKHELGAEIGIENECDPCHARNSLLILSSSNHLPPMAGNRSVTPVVLPSGRDVGEDAAYDRIAGKHKNDRNCARLLLYHLSWHAATRDNHVGRKSDNSRARIRIRSTFPPAKRSSMRKLRPFT
jgi:hypothetical protein